MENVRREKKFGWENILEKFFCAFEPRVSSGRIFLEKNINLKHIIGVIYGNRIREFFEPFAGTATMTEMKTSNLHASSVK